MVDGTVEGLDTGATFGRLVASSEAGVAVSVQVSVVTRHSGGMFGDIDSSSSSGCAFRAIRSAVAFEMSF